MHHFNVDMFPSRRFSKFQGEDLDPLLHVVGGEVSLVVLMMGKELYSNSGHLLDHGLRKLGYLTQVAWVQYAVWGTVVVDSHEGFANSTVDSVTVQYLGSLQVQLSASSQDARM